jgi:diaminopimelate decarboxylase
MSRVEGTVTAEGGRLLFDGVDVAGLAEHVETPFFLYSRRRIAANVARLRAAFEARHAATRVFFAGKACSNLWFLEQVRAAGAGVEVNSGGELWKALRAGFTPGQAVFNGVAKSRRELKEAVTAGIAGVVADSLCELRRAEEVARDLGLPARVLPRVDVNVSGGTHPGLETASGGKAGIDLGEAMEAFRLAAASPHLELAGLHLHIGSQITGVEPYLRALEVALDLVDDVERELGVILPALDLGGGFAVAYRERPLAPDGDYFFAPLAVEDYAAAICAEVTRRRPALELWLEPGRSIAADTAILVTRVESEKTKRVRDQLGRLAAEDRWLLVDAGYNTFFDPVLYGWYYPLASVSRPDAPADGRFRVAGPLCDGGDVYGGDDGGAHRRLPAATTVGDLLAFHDAGAYTLELMTPYNARPTAAAYAVTGVSGPGESAAGAEGAEVLRIRAPQSREDLVALDEAEPLEL